MTKMRIGKNGRDNTINLNELSIALDISNNYFENDIRDKFDKSLKCYLRKYTEEYYVYIEGVIDYFCNDFKNREYKNILLAKKLRFKIIEAVTKEMKIKYIGEDYYINKDYFVSKNY